MRALRLGSLVLGVLGLVVAASCDTGEPNGTSGGTPPETAGPEGAGAGGAGASGGSSPVGGASDSSSGGGSGEAPESPVPYVHFDVNHVISTGQSNSVAHEGRPPITSTQPFTNLMFDVGVMTSGACEPEGCRTYEKPSSFVPLIEGDSFWYPVETMSSGLANEAAMLAKTTFGKASHDVLVSLAGRNGLTYWCLRASGCNFIDPSYVNAFDENMMQVRDGKAIATAQGKSYVVRMVTAIHGESDDFAYATNTQEFPLDGTDGTPHSITSYADALIEWQRDYERGVKAITGQTPAVPLMISQFSGWNDFATSRVSQLQFEAHVRALGKVVIVTPGYTLDWAPDCRHYSAKGERQLGEYFGKAYARWVLEGRRWEPVRPTTVARAGSVISARFSVPSPPLVLDTTRVMNPGNYGFEVVDATGSQLAITAVALGAPDSVSITLSAAVPVGARLRYAFTGVPRSCPGPQVGPRGNLRDSDNTPSHYGYELFNWAVHFEVPIE